MLLTEQLLALATCQIASQTPRVKEAVSGMLDLKRLRQLQALVSTLIKLVWRLQEDAVVFQRTHLRLRVSGCGWGMVVQHACSNRNFANRHGSVSSVAMSTQTSVTPHKSRGSGGWVTCTDPAKIS